MATEQAGCDFRAYGVVADFRCEDPKEVRFVWEGEALMFGVEISRAGVAWMARSAVHSRSDTLAILVARARTKGTPGRCRARACRREYKNRGTSAVSGPTNLPSSPCLKIVRASACLAPCR
jgi:hypothetical protein